MGVAGTTWNSFDIASLNFESHYPPPNPHTSPDSGYRHSGKLWLSTLICSTLTLFIACTPNVWAEPFCKYSACLVVHFKYTHTHTHTHWYVKKHVSTLVSPWDGIARLCDQVTRMLATYTLVGRQYNYCIVYWNVCAASAVHPWDSLKCYQFSRFLG